jgi:purine-binding chemotaxis protein CheW
MAAVYARRALQLARRQMQVSDRSDALRVQAFSVGGQRCGIELSELAEVLPFAKCTPVPGVPPEFLGVMNMRGQIRAVVNLARLLAPTGTVNDTPGFVLMIRNRGSEVGLRVDRIDNVQLVQSEDLTTAGSAAAELSPRYVKGLTSDKLILLSTAAILSHDIFKTELHP